MHVQHVEQSAALLSLVLAYLVQPPFDERRSAVSDAIGVAAEVVAATIASGVEQRCPAGEARSRDQSRRIDVFDGAGVFKEERKHLVIIRLYGMHVGVSYRPEVRLIVDRVEARAASTRGTERID